jgi:hypothetical protein
VLSAAGERVTVFDNCPAQLEKAEAVVKREGPEIRLAQGDMKDLSASADESFDLIFHPVSDCFVDEVERDPLFRCRPTSSRGARRSGKG